MTLPFDDVPPLPEGRRIKPALGYLSTSKIDTGNGPDGSFALEVVHQKGRTLLQQVRHFKMDERNFADSVLFDRSSLRPLETWRWTPRGTYVTRYNHREVERVFRPLRGGAQRSIETLEVEPYSALGVEVVVAAMPLMEGYHGMIPVAVDTAPRGWDWLRFEVQREMTLQERPDMPEFGVWLVDCDIGKERTRLWISVEGRSVRKIEHLNKDNEILQVMRRTLLRAPQPVKHAE